MASFVLRLSRTQFNATSNWSLGSGDTIATLANHLQSVDWSPLFFPPFSWLLPLEPGREVTLGRSVAGDTGERPNQTGLGRPDPVGFPQRSPTKLFTAASLRSAAGVTCYNATPTGRPPPFVEGGMRAKECLPLRGQAHSSAHPHALCRALALIPYS